MGSVLVCGLGLVPRLLLDVRLHSPIHTLVLTLIDVFRVRLVLGLLVLLFGGFLFFRLVHQAIAG